MSAEDPIPDPVNRTMITLTVMLAAIMTVLDSTIANVALPHMAGSMSASADQINWVLTSYIIATAIMTPVTGWFAGRLGVKRLFLIAIIGFTIASAFCGYRPEPDADRGVPGAAGDVRGGDDAALPSGDARPPTP